MILNDFLINKLEKVVKDLSSLTIFFYHSHALQNQSLFHCGYVLVYWLGLHCI